MKNILMATLLAFGCSAFANEPAASTMPPAPESGHPSAHNAKKEKQEKKEAKKDAKKAAAKKGE